MAGPQTVWGLDVGKCALKAIKLRVGGDKSVEVVAADYIEHAKIMSQKDADAESLWTAAIEKFLSRNDISNDKVVVAVPGQLTLARFSKLPPVEKKKIPDIVKYEADQQIPFDMDEVVWDYQIFQAPDSPEVEVGIFAIKRDLIRDYMLRFEASDIEPLLVQSTPLALYNGMQYDGAMAKGAVVLVDIGTENTDLLVATEDSLWTRTINVGGNNFTEALVKSFKLSFTKAETLKRTAATSKYARQIFQAMRPVFADLVQELQRSIGFYTATHRDAELSRLIGLGSAFKLPGLQKYVQQNLQMDFTRLATFERIRLPETSERVSEQTGSFAVAYGLAVQGLGLSKVTSSLLPPEIAKQVVWRKKRPFLAAAAACLLASAGVVWFRGHTDASTLEANAGSENVSVAYEQAWQTITNPPTNVPPREYGKTIMAAATALKNKYSELSSQGETEIQKIETITKLLDNRAVWLKILAAIHGALPEPEGEIGAAADTEEYVAAIKASNTPRQARREIFVDSFQSEYKANVDDVVFADDWVGSSLTQVPNDTGEPRPGFVVTLRCRTPNRDKGLFVKDTFAKEIQKDTLGRKPGAGFYVNRVGVTGAEAATTSGTSTGRTTTRSRGRGRGRGTGGEEDTTTVVVDTTVDPLTGEPVTDDWSFVITLDVVLNDLPEKPEEPQDLSGGGQEQGG